MSIFVTTQSRDEDGLDVIGIYSTRENAEQSWAVLYEGADVDEWDLDADPGDPGHWHGPITKQQHDVSESMRRVLTPSFVALLKAHTVVSSTARSLPESSGKELTFYSFCPENGQR